MTGLEAMIFLNLYHESIASCGKSPDNLYDLHGCSGLVTDDNGPAMSAYLSMSSLKN